VRGCWLSGRAALHLPAAPHASRTTARVWSRRLQSHARGLRLDLDIDRGECCKLLYSHHIRVAHPARVGACNGVIAPAEHAFAVSIRLHATAEGMLLDSRRSHCAAASVHGASVRRGRGRRIRRASIWVQSGKKKCAIRDFLVDAFLQEHLFCVVDWKRRV
jgi:hypothetical protein